MVQLRRSVDYSRQPKLGPQYKNKKLSYRKQMADCSVLRNRRMQNYGNCGVGTEYHKDITICIAETATNVQLQIQNGSNLVSVLCKFHLHKHYSLQLKNIKHALNLLKFFVTNVDRNCTEHAAQQVQLMKLSDQSVINKSDKCTSIVIIRDHSIPWPAEF